ncbi:hypothetical protein D3C78_1559750 [compost metagenome]
MGVAERSAGKDEGAHALRQFTIGNRRRSFRRIEGEDDVEFPIRQLLLHVGIVLRIGFSLAP